MDERYSYNDLMQMQEQAIQRAREMQQRARLTIHDAQNITEAEISAAETQQDGTAPGSAEDMGFTDAGAKSDFGGSTSLHRSAAPSFPSGDGDGVCVEKSSVNAVKRLGAPSADAQKNRRHPLSGLYAMLQRLPADDDMTFILPIIMMLIKEGADEKLILALLYIMT